MAEILDSGERREFDTGAVRDISEGKGRCDLLPLDLLAAELQSATLSELENYRQTRKRHYLHNVLDFFCREAYGGCRETMYLELSKHYEEGAKKYAEDNWKKGIPYHCYVDSAVRHYLKWRRGDTDEHHDRAFVWNIVGLAWTDKHKPEMDDLVPAVTYTLDEIKAELGLDAETEEGTRRKTYLEDFLENSPTLTAQEVVINLCVKERYKSTPKTSQLVCDKNCYGCWNSVMTEEK